MATFISLINFTEQGVRSFKDTLDRAQTFADTAKQAGCSLRDIYWTIGPYDIVALVEAPDDETASALMLQAASLGNIRSTTLRGFSRDEMARILEKAG